MTNEEDKDNCELTDEDLLSALKEMRTYVDITIGDLKTIYSLARQKARQRKTRDQRG